MITKQYQHFGGTTACTLRSVDKCMKFDYYPIEDDEEDMETERSRLFLGDSWFGSVKCCANIVKRGGHAILQIKTNHSRSPKLYLEELMKDWPGGTWVVMEGVTEKEDVALVCIGYKYNKKKVLTFVCSKGAGSTEAGKPYEAKFPDRFGNVCVRHVGRPCVINTFFSYCSIIDNWNQMRQFELALEKKWVTQDGYFRLYTTFLGFDMAEVYKVMPNVVGETPRNILELADEVVVEMLEEAEELEKQSNQQEPAPDEIILQVNGTTISSATSSSSIVKIQHTQEWLKWGKQVRCVWCSRVNFSVRKTTLLCIECNKGFCRDSSGRNCWSHHLALGGCPKAPERGMIQKNMKRKLGEVEI